MEPTLRLAGLSMLMMLVTNAWGLVIRVPQDVDRIQDGLDLLQDGDTVLVSLGTYAEALIGPALHFTLKGDVVPDTGEYPRPIIDPSPLPGSDTSACLILPHASRPVLEDLVFRNGPQMYPHAENRTGGIQCSGLDFVARRCLFDSTFRTLQFIFPGPDLNIVDSLEDCIFRDLQHVGVYQLDYAVVARDCRFLSGNCFNLCVGGAGSRIENCFFGPNPGGGGLVVDGPDVEVSECRFSSDQQTMRFSLNGYSQQGVFQQNLFTECVVSDAVFRCGVLGPDCVQITDNLFLNNVGSDTATSLWIGRSSGYHAGWGGEIRSNYFSNCYTQEGPANALFTNQDMVLTRNHFNEALGPNGHPYIGASYGQTTLRENLFNGRGYALNVTGATVDAELNWWGDPTGPYHLTDNPGGRGDTITGNVDFIPWYEDTTFLFSSDRTRLLPDRFVFEAYPNPFNSILHVTLIPSQVGIVKVELFDVLGRKAEEIWHGPLAFQKDVTFDASALASGIYFARVTDVISRKNLAMAKLVLLK